MNWKERLQEIHKNSPEIVSEEDIKILEEKVELMKENMLITCG